MRDSKSTCSLSMSCTWKKPQQKLLNFKWKFQLKVHPKNLIEAARRTKSKLLVKRKKGEFEPR